VNLKVIKEFIVRHQKDIFIIVITSVISMITTWHFSNIDFKDYQRKVAKEALEKIKLEQSFCDTSLRFLNEKMGILETNKDWNRDIINEYFISLRIQLSMLRDVINSSRLTWANIFPDESERVEKMDSRFLSTLAKLESLEERMTSIEEITAPELKDLKLEIAKEKESLQNIFNSYLAAPPTSYPSVAVTSDSIATGITVLPSGKTFNFDKFLLDADGNIITTEDGETIEEE
jgi:predicted small secreted protein